MVHIIYCLSNFYYFFYFIGTLLVLFTGTLIISFIYLSLSSRKECGERNVFILHFHITYFILSYDYSYILIFFLKSVILGWCNIVLRKDKPWCFTSLLTHFYLSNNKLGSINEILDLVTAVPSTWENVWWRFCRLLVIMAKFKLIFNQWYSTYSISLISPVYFSDWCLTVSEIDLY